MSLEDGELPPHCQPLRSKLIEEYSLNFDLEHKRSLRIAAITAVQDALKTVPSDDYALALFHRLEANQDQDSCAAASEYSSDAIEKLHTVTKKVYECSSAKSLRIVSLEEQIAARRHRLEETRTSSNALAKRLNQTDELLDGLRSLVNLLHQQVAEAKSNQDYAEQENCAMNKHITETLEFYSEHQGAVQSMSDSLIELESTFNLCSPNQFAVPPPTPYLSADYYMHDVLNSGPYVDSMAKWSLDNWTRFSQGKIIEALQHRPVQ